MIHVHLSAQPGPVRRFLTALGDAWLAIWEEFKWW